MNFKGITDYLADPLKWAPGYVLIGGILVDGFVLKTGGLFAAFTILAALYLLVRDRFKGRKPKWLP